MGRRDEREALAALVDDAREGRSGAVVVSGAPGSGKTLLLAGAAEGAVDCRVLRARAVEVESGLTFGTLQQLCGPLTDAIDDLPEPQALALGAAFGVVAGPSPDPFLVGVGLVSLLAATASVQPVVCVVDDAQWMDPMSARALGFAARRLDDSGVAMLFSARGTCGLAALAGLNELRLRPLSPGESQLLLSLELPGRIDVDVRDRILAEARGNPLSIRQFARSTTIAGLAGGFGIETGLADPDVAAVVLPALESLPRDAAQVLLLAAAEPLGDPTILQSALTSAGLSNDAVLAAVSTGLVQVGDRVLFFHPVARQVIYGSGSDAERCETHRLLADAADGSARHDHAAWHRALAGSGRLEELAEELERTSGSARAAGGVASAAAFMSRARAVSEERGPRSRRALDAALLHHRSGEFHEAVRLASDVEHETLGDRESALSHLVHAAVAASRGRPDASRDLVVAAGRLAPTDPEMSSTILLSAFDAATTAGRLGPHGGVHQVAADALRTSPRPTPATPGTPVQRLVDALAAWWSGGDVTDHDALSRAVESCCADESTVHPMATRTAMELWDGEAWATLAQRSVDAARRTGVIADLPRALDLRACLHVLRGEFAIAEAVVEESVNAARVLGLPTPDLASILLDGWRCGDQDAHEWLETWALRASSRSDGSALTMLEYCRALTHIASGRYEEAMDDALQVMRRDEPVLSAWAAPEVVEAAVRAGRPELAEQAIECVRSISAATGSRWAQGIELRCSALLAADDSAESLFTASIRHLEQSGMRLDLARTHLLYGEWLRRQKRRVDSRSHLRSALEVFDAVGAVSFAGRASIELRSSGEQARRRSPETITELTERESQVAALACDGHTNPGIGRQLFISPRTVEYHLHKVFSKLGITSRAQLGAALQH